ncbi:hypothetical protein B0J13DRAFT_244820 [Dactylonectria estremocensis]|uniref:Uncharacterized protein n=1 Tax=Dactylonectria estremocensis TaxID=1079267 RepID=A0A9P9D575_9HYPO|nr:hypothetical protein B0J13DRAFT_244820 [Dactylonectria estremocensis]
MSEALTFVRASHYTICQGIQRACFNVPEMGTFFFLSDHCHVIENVTLHHFLNPDLDSVWAKADNSFNSGETVFRKVDWLDTIQPGSEALSA